MWPLTPWRWFWLLLALPQSLNVSKNMNWCLSVLFTSPHPQWLKKYSLRVTISQSESWIVFQYLHLKFYQYSVFKKWNPCYISNAYLLCTFYIWYLILVKPNNWSRCISTTFSVDETEDFRANNLPENTGLSRAPWALLILIKSSRLGWSLPVGVWFLALPFPGWMTLSKSLNFLFLIFHISNIIIPSHKGCCKDKMS